MNRTARAPQAGFTLIELVIATAVASILVIGGVALLVNQQRRFQTSSADRALQETARVAMSELSASLRTAGYGVDPPLAFDFGFAQNLTMAAAPRVSGVTVRNGSSSGAGSYTCTNAVTCRDSITGPDEIVFYARDPFFGHTVTAVNGTSSVAISGPLGVDLYRGQVLLLMCTSGGMYWAYVTVGAHVAATTSTASVTVPLLSGSGSLLDFPYQNGLLTHASTGGCYSGDGSVLVSKVDRFRYFVGTYDDGGNLVPPQTDGSRPFLMLDRGLSDDGGAALTPVVIAPDVEDVQLSYHYPSGAVALVGATASTLISSGAGGIDLAPANGGPGYGTSMTDPSRQNQFPSNIRAVRVSLVVRSATRDFTVPDTAIPAAANRPQLDGLANYRRLKIETTVPIRNLDARYPYYPVVSNGSDNNNVGGG